jgi:hypothetical protein
MYKSIFFVLLISVSALAFEDQQQSAEVQQAKDEDRSFFFQFIDELLWDDVDLERATKRMFRDGIHQIIPKLFLNWA